MERRAFMLSAFLSAFAMFLVWNYISRKDADMEDAYGLATSEQVVVASRDVLQYETIRPTDVETISVPKIALSPGRINNPTDVIDSVAAVPLRKGEFILDNKIISKNIYSGLDSQVSMGHRAISIPVNYKSGVGFLLRPGDRVDLAAHFEYRSTSARISEVKIFMQDLLVLASGRTIQADPPNGVDQNIMRTIMSTKGNENVNPEDVRAALNYAKTDANYQTVTLEVTPQQAQIIVYVMTVFRDSIICMLRQSDDRQLQRMGTTDLAAVMGENSFYAKGKKAPPPVVVPLPKFFDYVGGEPVPVTQ